MAWDPYTDPVNHIVLAGKTSPGLADVAGAGTPRNWEERQGYGMSGAVLWFTGRGLANFAVKLRFYNSRDIAAWHVWKPVVQAVPFGRLPKALDIWHPLLEDLDIKSVQITDVKQLTQVEDGVWEVTIEFRQYRRLKLSLMKPEGSADKEPADPWEQKLQDLGNQANANSAALADEVKQHPDLYKLFGGT